jgi:hypothetical protein
MSTFPLISYNSIDISFDRHLNNLQPVKRERTIVNRSPFSGVTEILDMYGDEAVSVGIDRLSAELIDQLEEWYEYVKGGGLFDFIGDQGLGLYLGFEGKSLLSNDKLTGNFVRSGVSYVEDPDTGLLVSIAENTARFPSGKFGRGVLIEPMHTNILIKSAAFDNVAWTAADITVAANTTEVKDPLDTNTAEKVTTTDTNGTLTQDTASGIGIDCAHFSVYLRTTVIGRTAVLKIMDDSGATLKSETVTMTPEWARYTAHYVNAADANANHWRVQILFPDDASVHYIFGAQLEVNYYVNGYVPTDAASASHQPDILYYELTEGEEVDHLYGSLAFWIKSHFSHDEDGAKIASRALMELTDADDAYVIRVSRDSNGKLRVSYQLSDGTTKYVYDDFTMERDTWCHIVVTWDMTALSNAICIYQDGALLSAHAESGGLTKVIDRLFVGSGNLAGTVPTDFSGGIYDDIILRKDVMSAADVKALYLKGKSAGHRRNRFEDCILLDPEFSPIVNQGGNVFDFDAEFTVNPT